MARGFLEKIGLVERVETEPVGIVLDENYCPEEQTEEIEVETDNVSEDNFVADVYANNDLSDLSKSIFKVEEIKHNLPTTMPNDTMRASVIGILASFQLTSEDVKADAEKRKIILEAALKQITDENEALIAIKQQEIEEAKKLIEDYQKVIAGCEQLVKTATDNVEVELNRIQKLADFVTVEPVEGESK